MKKHQRAAKQNKRMEKDEGVRLNKKLRDALKSKDSIKNSSDITEARAAVRQHMLDTQKINSKQSFGRSAVTFFFYDSYVKCSKEECRGFRNSFTYSQSVYRGHVERCFPRKKKFSEFCLVGFRMENEKLVVMGFEEMKLWFRRETARQENFVGSKLWTKNKYPTWSQRIVEAVEDDDLKFSDDARGFEQKFRNNNQSRGWDKIFVVNDPSGLGADFPDETTLLRTMRQHGNRKLRYFDSQTMEFYDCSWSGYLDRFSKEEKHRDHIVNCLGLDASVPALRNAITVPKFARTCSNSMTPMKHLEKYIIISQKGAFSEFHTDFGGMSAYFHILKGIKTFFFIEPTEENLKKLQNYEEGHHHRKDNHWFGRKIATTDIKRVTMSAGRTFFMPAGWIHAVYTDEDCIAYSGSFFEKTNIPRQIRIFQHEEDAGIEQDFRIPQFVPVHLKFFEKELLSRVQEYNSRNERMNVSNHAWEWNTFQLMRPFLKTYSLADDHIKKAWKKVEKKQKAIENQNI
ncbi:hypothetical protein CAEBREN_24469 [Caenorhabditis brenneri]|uniref:JmjC domain-containing protein n=1 Tax=Caenorhabditis brenneri TaxID=135651 RepID=G0NQW0_CAEBE|nr:hypothetical protein CAEBREN_24469 [Caenorhabditis brenneri]